MTKSQGTGLLVLAYIIMIVVVTVGTMYYLGALNWGSGRWVHFHHHACIVWTQANAASISCDWGKP